MGALEFCKRISEVVGIPYLADQVREHYSNRNSEVHLYYDMADDIWWASIYLTRSDRLLSIGWSEMDNFWLQENPEEGDVFDHKCSKTLAPCLRELKKILKEERVIA